jgi:RNA polymerase sigma factor (sigma-70 family)
VGSRLGRVLCQLRDLSLRGEAFDDAELLERFITMRDEDAFAALVARHGPMVLACARRVAGNVHDADDAFQATFLVLARKAASVQPRGRVGNWLYGVAYHAAQKARAAALRRHTRERQVAEMPHPTVERSDAAIDLKPLLDQELNRLGEKHRLPIVLCDLEGRGRREVARELGIPEGTLSSRLTNARRALASRLTRRGVTLSAGAIAYVLSETAVPAAVPPLLAQATVRAALRVASGEAVTAVVPLSVAALTQGVLKTMALSKVKLALVAFLAVGLLFVRTAGEGIHVPQAKADSAPPAAAADDKTSAAWADLSGTDDVKVARAILTLGATPKETVQFLKDNLYPVKADAKRVEKLIADLDSDKYPVREAAAQQLEYLGKCIKTELEKAAADGKSEEVKRRAKQLLERLPSDGKKKDPAGPGVGKNGAQNVQVQNNNGQIRIIVNGAVIDPNAPAPAAKMLPTGPSPMWIRATRAIAILEHVGTPEATQLLEAIAGGEADALPTQQAKAALARMKK